MENDTQDKKMENKKEPRLFCPVIKDTCLKYGCMFYREIFWWDKDSNEHSCFDCVYVHTYYNLGSISP
jgi:hypothetical protein